MQEVQKQNNTSFYTSGSKHLDKATMMAYGLYRSAKALQIPNAIKRAARETAFHWRFRGFPRSQIEKHLRRCIELKSANKKSKQ